MSAIYHLGYTHERGHPHIWLHSNSHHFEGFEEDLEDIADYQDFLGLNNPFSIDPESFGFDGVGKIEDSSRVLGWSALRLTVPRLGTYSAYAYTTESVLPVVATLAQAIHQIQSNPNLEKSSPADDDAQFVSIGIGHEVPHNQPYSAPLRATISPDALTWLDLIEDKAGTEARVTGAISQTFRHVYPQADESDFRVNLDGVISFSYPGDGSSFHGFVRPESYVDGLKIHAANNDYPIQQLALIAGLAALTDSIIDVATS